MQLQPCAIVIIGELKLNKDGDIMAKDFTPDELDRKCNELNDLFTKNTKEIAKAIKDNHVEWLTELGTNDSLRIMVILFIKALTDDLKTVGEVRLEMSDWL